MLSQYITTTSLDNDFNVAFLFSCVFLIYPQRLCFFTLLVIFSLFMFTVVFFVLREIMFHVSTLLPFSNGDSQQVIMYVTVPSRGFPPDTISVTPRLLSCKSATEENQRTFLFIFPPPTWPKPQFNKISKFQFVKFWLKNKISSATWKGSCSSCSEEKSPMEPNPDPKQYWNN